MYKKIFICLGLVLAGCTGYAQNNYNETFKGFQNLERKQQFNVINRLQAIADNDNIEFSKLWPYEYFYNDGINTFIYAAGNEDASLELVKFDLNAMHDECFDISYPDFCIPKISPTMISYIYNERLVVDNTPDFVNAPKSNEVFEILLKGDNHFDKKMIKFIDNTTSENIKKECEVDSADKIKNCKTYDEDSKELLYTENLVLKDSFQSVTPENIVKYIKYDANNKKIEQYVYETGKHTFYNPKGEITAQYQIKDGKFKYYDNKLPELYIDMEYIKDDDGNVIEEKYYDRNQRIMRKYTAEYSNGEISKIHVYDIFNQADWEIIPIAKKEIQKPEFEIRH
ncbi:hypothetical protein IJ541_06155 [bacterium]|nr:hypothetical protein [bacterium]